jgi:hypothetical protein
MVQPQRENRLHQNVFFIALIGAAALAACSSDRSSVPPALPVSAAPTAALPAAVATGCIGASAASQTTPLPAAGGVTGTVTVGAVAGAANACALAVTVATGGDATLTSTVALASARRTASTAATPLPTPLAQVELSTTTTTATWLAVSLTVPSSVPAGTYPATITTTIDLGEGQTYTTTTNYTITVASNGTAAITGLNVTLGQYSAGLLTIYPAGTVLPTPSAAPSPSATPTATPTATATPTSAPSATPTPTPSPSPTPTTVATTAADCLTVNALTACGSYVANGSYDGPAGFYSPAPTPGVTTPQPLYNHSVQGDLEGYVTIPYYWFAGTITITLDNYAPGQQQTPTNNCPSTLTLTQSGILGDTYTLTIPANGAQSAVGTGTGCNINIGVPNELAAGGAYNLTIGYLNSLTPAQL